MKAYRKLTVLACAMTCTAHAVFGQGCDAIADPQTDLAAPATLQGFFQNTGAADVFEGCVASDGAQGDAVCTWQFAVTDPASLPFYQTLDAQLTGCLAQDAQITTDTGVNHPDAYDARTFDLAQHRISLARKVKSQLGWTFVTVRVFNTD